MHRIESPEIDPHHPGPSIPSRPHQASVCIMELRLRDSLVSGPEPHSRCECHLGSPSLHNITRLFIPLPSAAVPPPLHLYPNTSTCGMTSSVKAPFLLGNQPSFWHWDLQPLSCDHCIRWGGMEVMWERKNTFVILVDPGGRLKRAHEDICLLMPVTCQTWKGVLLMGTDMYPSNSRSDFHGAVPPMGIL